MVYKYSVIEQKYIISELNIFTKKWITWQGERIKTSYLADLIDQFLSKWVSYGRDWIKLNSRVLKYQYGSQYVKMIDWLIHNNVIYLWKNYSVGLKSKCYKLTDFIKSKQIINASIEIPNRLIGKRKDILNSGITIDADIIAKVIGDLKSVSIDKHQAIEWCNKNIEHTSIQYLSNSMAINRIASGQLYSNFDKFGRFHSNFTVLKKEIRQEFLKINGNKTHEIDIKNSQPFFLWLLMQDDKFNNNESFADDVLAGSVYDKMSEDLKCSRKEAKVHTYRVLFGRNKESKSDIAFKSLYPNTFNWILKFKKECKSYKSLAQKLQKRESDFIFSTLIPEIIEWNNVPLITIHDSIIFEEEWKDEIEKIFINAQTNLIEQAKRIPLAQ